MLKVKYRSLARMLIAIALFNVADFFATQDLVAYGEHSEWNPLMRSLVGTPYFALYKLVLSPTGLLFLWLVRKAAVPRYMGWIRLACCVYALLMVYTWAVFYA